MYTTKYIIPTIFILSYKCIKFLNLNIKKIKLLYNISMI